MARLRDGEVQEQGDAEGRDQDRQQQPPPQQQQQQPRRPALLGMLSGRIAASLVAALAGAGGASGEGADEESDDNWEPGPADEVSFKHGAGAPSLCAQETCRMYHPRYRIASL